jgi:hypothetical protein
MNYFLPAWLGSGMYNLLTIRRLTASSRSSGLLVAPIIRILAFSPANVLAPSSYTRNSVLILLEDSMSFSFLEQSNESISSMKMTVG